MIKVPHFQKKRITRQAGQHYTTKTKTTKAIIVGTYYTLTLGTDVFLVLAGRHDEGQEKERPKAHNQHHQGNDGARSHFLLHLGGPGMLTPRAGGVGGEPAELGKDRKRSRSHRHSHGSGRLSDDDGFCFRRHGCGWVETEDAKTTAVARARGVVVSIEQTTEDG